MSDRWAVVLALAAAAGASRPAPVPLLLGAAAVLAALLLRRPGLLCLAVAILVSSLAWRSLAGLDGVTEAAVQAEVTLLSDPRPTFSGVRVDARLGGRRVELRASGVAADALRPRLAGERVQVRGDLRPAPSDAPWLVARHVSARVQVYLVEGWRPGDLQARVANALRRTLVEGAESLGTTHRSLYTGLVFGDDRHQPAALADDFLGAGLTHLVAVSGQNVAFVLALGGPVLRRFRLWPRLAMTLALVGLFGVMTRFEPSVLRAAAMAALATTVTTIGSPVSRLRVLALAVTGLLVVDPLLVGSVGFQLSVAASAAIVLWAPRVVEALPGPRLLREPLGVTVAAQLGVAPVLLATFGPLPVASFPANLLAGPAAGAVMVWGLTGGMLAGVVGGPVAELLHLPTKVLLAWLADVARRMSLLPLGMLGAAHVVALSVGLGLGAWARPGPSPGAPDEVGTDEPVGRGVVRATGRLRSRWIRGLGLVLAASAIGAAVLTAQAPPPLRDDLRLGVVRWHAGTTDVVVLGGVGGRSPLGDEDVLAVLREARVGSIDVLVVADPSVAGAIVTAVEDRHPVGSVVVADGVEVLGAGPTVVPAPTRPSVVSVGALDLHLTPTADRLVVDARPRSP